jgi:hypothetical protein
MRAWYLGADQTVLVIDQVGRPVSQEEAATLIERTTAKGVFADTIIAADEVYIPAVDDPDPEESGPRLHADEIRAIERAVDALPATIGNHEAISALSLLLDRVRGNGR